MRGFFYKVFRNVTKIFSGRNLIWHLLAIALTYLLVTSGFDWFYYSHTRFKLLEYFIFPAVILGGLLPILTPFTLLLIGKVRQSLKILDISYALAQAALLGLVISDFYKAFTGRIPPPEIFGQSNSGALIDISHGFRFGFLRGGVFWGWPSSHTTIAFAMALALIILYPKNKLVRVLALFYAFYVGISVSVSIHWFSEFIAGAIIGTVIGIVVGKSFRNKTIN
jgi:membrane-associated phospholipid phosphatase